MFYDRFPGDYEDTRDTNPLDLLLSGILAAQQVDIANFQLLPNIVKSRSKIINGCLRELLAQKYDTGCACATAGIPVPSVNAGPDKKQNCNNGPNEHHAGKQKNERVMGRHVNSFNNHEIAYRYVDLYERILQRPLVAPEPKKAPKIMKKGHTRISDDQAISYRRVRSTQPDRIPHERISTPAIAPI